MLAQPRAPRQSERTQKIWRGPSIVELPTAVGAPLAPGQGQFAAIDKKRDPQIPNTCPRPGRTGGFLSIPVLHKRRPHQSSSRAPGEPAGLRVNLLETMDHLVHRQFVPRRRRLGIIPASHQRGCKFRGPLPVAVRGARRGREACAIVMLQPAKVPLGTAESFR